MKITAGKRKGMQAVSNERGVIAAAAMDQRGSLKSAIAKDKGIDKNAVTPEMMAEFKGAVVRILTPYASAILLDPEYGLQAAKGRAKNAGLLLAYENSGYDNTRPGRLPDLLDDWSVRRLVAAGADCIKILLYYTPFDPPATNEIKHAWVERIGAECIASDVPFFLEFVGYQENGDEKGIEFAKKKPEIVTKSMEEFSKLQYAVDVLKVEVPVNMNFVAGTRAVTLMSCVRRDERTSITCLLAVEAPREFGIGRVFRTPARLVRQGRDRSGAVETEPRFRGSQAVVNVLDIFDALGREPIF